jgi:lysophospholipase L1-like esterase
MVKPFQIFLFGVSVLLILLGISFIFPEGTIKTSLIEIRIPSFSNTDSTSQEPYKDISEILKFAATIDSTESFNPNDSSRMQDSIAKPIKYAKLSTDSLKKTGRIIEYPEGNDTVLFSAFRNMQQISAHPNVIHILHYGDSQIEGDRITSYLRNQLQKQFGGEGIGLFPIVSANPAGINYIYQISENWIKYSPLENAKELKHNKFGALISVFKITNQSGLFKKKEDLEGGITLEKSNSTYIRAQQFKKCHIYYGFCKDPMIYELKQSDSIIDSDIAPATPDLKELTWEFNKTEKNLKLIFKATTSPNFYGISLTGNTGINIDNIPLRGSSGLEFAKTDKEFMRSFYEKLNVKMIILQFGVNIVPNVTSNYAYYEKSFQKQLEFLKEVGKGAPILVIGVSDVSRNGRNGLESYPNIEMIRDAQKRAAFNAGCAFWDMYQAMGGKNSMISWVNTSPSLAQKDFIHLNPAGARIIAEMLYQSIISEYNRYTSLQQN